jgi:hypothetical protein
MNADVHLFHMPVRAQNIRSKILRSKKF